MAGHGQYGRRSISDLVRKVVWRTKAGESGDKVEERSRRAFIRLLEMARERLKEHGEILGTSFSNINKICSTFLVFSRFT